MSTDAECRVAGRYPLTHLQWSRLERARQAREKGEVERSNLMRHDHQVVGAGALAHPLVGSDGRYSLHT